MVPAVDNPPEWPLPERVRWLRAFRRSVSAHRQALIASCVDEIHKTPWEALTADVLPLLSAAKWHERFAGGLLRDRRMGGGPWWALGQSHRVRRGPLGTVGIIATWNYPVQLLGVQMVQALAAGNRVVVKPSERAPRTQGLLLALARDAGLPSGQLEWTEATREAGAGMLRERRFDHVVFTGSTAVGREIARWASETLTPTTLELSGRDSAFVLGDADPRVAARSIWNGATTNAGQTCMAPRRALVDRSIYAALLAELAPLAAGARPRRLIDEQAAARVDALARDACERGGRSLSGVLEPVRGDTMTPVAIADCPPDASLVGGDHFGPALAVVPVDSLDDALRIHFGCDQHLATSVFTRSRRNADALIERLGSTTVTVNDCLVPTGHPGASISGRGLSGWGESRGAAGLLSMTRPVHISRTPALRPSIFEPAPGQRRRFEGVMDRVYGKSSRSPAGESDRPGPTINRDSGRAAEATERVPSDSAV
ncbi:MAG: aldehyde dehydrogenase family protein [Phycisphaerales bacterium]